jgi:hypothetical protein
MGESNLSAQSDSLRGRLQSYLDVGHERDCSYALALRLLFSPYL